MTAEGATSEEWLAGYRWALEHLTDPGVLRDAAQYVDERGTPLTATPGQVARPVVEPDAGVVYPVRPAPGHESGAPMPPETTPAEPEWGSPAWEVRRKELWDREARALMAALITYEAEHAGDAICLMPALDAARTAVPHA